MRYLCLVYLEPHALDGLTAGEHAALARESMAYDVTLQQAGHYILAEALKPTRTATTLRKRDGAVSMTDGPFAETKEVLGGFILIEAPDREIALRLAGDIPMAHFGSIEVRPIQDFDESGTGT